MKRSRTALIALIGILIGGCQNVGENDREPYAVPKSIPTGKEADRSGKDKFPQNGVKRYVDVRGEDLRQCDLRYANDILETLRFNEETLWPPPDRLPKGFDPNVLLQEGMNPGLGVCELHSQGITGKGVYVAIIDQPTYLTHPEFVGKVVAYHDVGCESVGTMHGTAVTSLLVGTRCGTAPDARVLYAAAPSWTGDSAYYAEALDWIRQYNRGLSDSERVRVVCVTAAPSGLRSLFKKNQAQWDKALVRAQEEGILVLDCTLEYGFISACWYDRSDRENPAGCTPGYPGMPDRYRPENLMAPTSFRTVANQDEVSRPCYQYLGRGGLSWGIPYVAGVLAMGWQVRPELSPEQMKDMLFESAHEGDNGVKIIDPKAFIQMVRTERDVSE